jgi:hypothetical protein
MSAKYSIAQCTTLSQISPKSRLFNDFCVMPNLNWSIICYICEDLRKFYVRKSRPEFCQSWLNKTSPNASRFCAIKCSAKLDSFTKSAFVLDYVSHNKTFLYFCKLKDEAKFREFSVSRKRPSFKKAVDEF